MSYNNFSQNNNFNGNNQQNGEQKPKENFNIVKIYATGGRVNLSMWTPSTGSKGIIRIEQSVGKDPSTGADIFENRMPSELPGFFLNQEDANVINEVISRTAPDYTNLNLDKYKKANGDTISIVNTGNAIKLDIHSEKKGDRTATFSGVQVGSSMIFPGFITFARGMKLIATKIFTDKVSDPAFDKAFDAMNGEENSEDSPF